MDLNSEALPGEVLGKTCADGGTCHHRCDERALRPELNLQPGRCFRREGCSPFSDYSGPWAYDKPEEAMPVITARFHVEHNGVIGSTDAPVKRIEKNDDGSFTVVIDYWPQATCQECKGCGEVETGIGMMACDACNGIKRKEA
jgi:hypothetical protein